MSVTIRILETNFAMNSMSCYSLWFSEYNSFLREGLLNYIFLNIICQECSGPNLQTQSANGIVYFRFQV